MSTVSTSPEPLWSEWTTLARSRTIAVFVSAAAAGIATDLALRHGPQTISGALLVAVTATALVAAARPENPQAVAMAGAALVFGSWLAVRTSPWILPLDIVAAGGLLALAAAYARGGSVLDLSVPRAVVHAFRAVANALLAPGYLLQGANLPILRGVLLAVPLVVIVGALLASADAVFASAVRFHWDDLVFHVFAVTLGAWTMTALLRLASVRQPSPLAVTGPRLGATEWTIVFVALDVLLAGFAVARLIALTEGGRRVISTAGLTYAEYARSGFFQLLAACVVAFGAVIVLRAVADTPETHRRFVLLAEIALGLLLLVVVQAVQRLALYERAFGLTMPRLLATAVCVWMGLALLALGVWVAGVAGHRHWFWAVTGVVGLAILLALNMINAEALVVERNVARTASTGDADALDLWGLGDDAAPALERSLPKLDGHARRAVLLVACTRDELGGSVWSYNGGHDAAVEARNRMCTHRNERTP